MVEVVEDNLHLPIIVRCKVVVEAAVVVEQVQVLVILLEMVILVMHYLMVTLGSQVWPLVVDMPDLVVRTPEAVVVETVEPVILVERVVRESLLSHTILDK